MRRIRIVAIVAVSLFVCASVGVAQDGPAGFLYVVQADVKPGMAGQYEDFIKKVQEGATGAPETVLVYQRALGGSINTYLVAIPFNEWSEMDGWMGVPQILARAYGETEAVQLLEASGGALESLSVRITRRVPEFSSAAPPVGPPTQFAQIVRTEIEPGLATQYDQFLRRLKAAEEKAGISSNRSVAAQGELSTYSTVRFFNTYAERGGWVAPAVVLRDAFGEDDARALMQMQAEAVQVREVSVVRFRPDLSRLPGSTSNQ